MAQIKFFRGTRANYNTDLSGTKQAEVKNGIYFITDEHCIMMNEKQYGGVDNVMFEGFIKDVDVEGNLLSFKKAVEGTWTEVSIKLLEAADKSIVVGDILKEGGVKDGSTIKVNVKDVGTEDGLKLGNDGLYVDLAKTTNAITEEVKRAKTAEGANATAIGNETTNRTKAISALEKKVNENIAAELTYKTVKLTDEEVTALADANVKEAYKVVSVTKGGKETTVGDIIKIYKDSSLESIDYVKEDDKKKAGQFLKYVYTLANGTEKTVYVDMSELVDQAEVENGIQAVNGKLSIKIDEAVDADDFLTVSDKGLKLSGVKTAISDAQKAVQGNLDKEINRAKTAEGANATAIANEKARATATENTIEASVGLADDGSHKKTTGNYTSKATTVVGEIAALDTKVKENDDAIKVIQSNVAVANAVTVKGSTNITVTPSTEGTDKHKVFTVAAKDLTTTTQHGALITRVANTENSINTLNGAATVVGSVAKSVADAKTELLGDAAADYNTLGKLEDKIQALDNKVSKAHTEVNAKADGHVRVSVANSTDGTHKVVTVTENDIASAVNLTAEINRAKTAEGANATAIGKNTAAITTLNGTAAVKGSVYYKIAEALTWIEGGTY